MKTVLVACETIEDEVLSVLNRLGLDYPVIWLEGGLHNTPDRLRSRIGEVLREAEGRCELLIFTLGYCGGGVSDLRTGNYTTVLPLADDCISILLGSMAARRKISQRATYFLTEGWMRHENNIVTSYHRTVEKYGQAKADRINKMMLNNYERLGLIDTGTFDLEEAHRKVEPLAAKLDLPVENLPGDNGWLENLLLGPYDDPSRFLVIPPDSEINFDCWKRFLENPVRG